MLKTWGKWADAAGVEGKTHGANINAIGTQTDQGRENKWQNNMRIHQSKQNSKQISKRKKRKTDGDTASFWDPKS